MSWARRQQHLTTGEFNSQWVVLHPNVTDLGAEELLKKCFFGSTQWFESVQLPQVRLLWFYKSQGKRKPESVQSNGFHWPTKPVLVCELLYSSYFPADAEV